MVETGREETGKRVSSAFFCDVGPKPSNLRMGVLAFNVRAPLQVVVLGW